MTDPFKTEDVKSRVTLQDVLAPVQRHRRSAIGGFAFIFALANVFAWVWAANYYKAQMQVLVEQDRSDPVITAGQDSAVSQSKQITTDQVSSEVALIQGTDMLRAAADSCGLAQASPSPSWMRVLSPDPPSHAVTLAVATAKLAKRLTVAAEPTSDVITVSYGHRGRPETPACVLQQLSRLYLEKHLRLRRQLGSALLFAEETERYRKELAAAESRVSQFSQTSGSGDPGTLKMALAEQVAASQAALDRAQETVIVNQKRMEDVKNQMQIIPQRSETAKQETSAYLLIQKLQGDLLAADLKRTQLLIKYDPNYPLVKEVDQEIAKTQAALEESRHTTYLSDTTDRDQTFELLRQDLAKTEADASAAVAGAEAIQVSINRMRVQMIHLDQQAIQRASLEREVKAQEGRYLLYLNKSEQERISNALDKRGVADVAISVAPTVPAVPAYNPWLILALGTLFAVIIGGSLAYVADYLDPFLRSPGEIDRELGLPIIAEFSV